MPNNFENINIGHRIVYFGDNYQWYSGIVENKGSASLDVRPTDCRLDTQVRRLWDSSSKVFQVDENDLSGNTKISQLKRRLSTQMQDHLSFYLDELIEQLPQVRENYNQ